jgi:hypothetical protein
LLLFFFFVAVVLGREVHLALTASPGDDQVDYAQQLHDLAASIQPRDASADAWPQLIRACDIAAAVQREFATAPGSEEFPKIHFEFIYQQDKAVANPNERAARQSLRESAERALAALKERGAVEALNGLVSATRAVRPKFEERPLWNARSMDLGPGRTLAYSERARMYLAGQEKNESELIAAFERTLALARIRLCEPMLLARLVGIATQSEALNEVRSQCVERTLPGATCRALLAAIVRQSAYPDATAAIEGERLLALDAIQWCHTGDGRLIYAGEHSFLPEESRPANPLVNLRARLSPSKEETTNLLNRYFDLAVRIVKSRHWTQWLEASELNAEIEKNPFARVYLPAVHKYISSNTRAVLDLAGVTTLLAIEAFRAERGGLPRTLDDLVPAVLGALPADPYALDGRLIYRVLDHPDKFGRDFLLYSVGLNQKDDGGEPDPECPECVLWQNSDYFDYIINRPRE